MKSTNKSDNFDKILFDYFNKHSEKAPLSTQKVIKNALINDNKKRKNSFLLIKKVAIIIFCICIGTISTVYAKDILNFISNIFNNSTFGIDQAVKSGYVQNIDMDFLISNNIGLKVDYILMDSKSLDISFIYKYYGNQSNITELKYADLTITDENDNLLCCIFDNNIGNNNIIGNNIYSSSEQQFIDDNTIKDSLLVTSNNFPNSNILYITITKILLTQNNRAEYITGNWSFSIDLSNKIITKSTNLYSSTSSPYVDSLNIYINETTLSIELQLNTFFDESLLYKHNSIILKDESNNIYYPLEMTSKNNIDIQPNTSNIILTYPISIYTNLNNLYLHINLNHEQELNIELTKTIKDTLN